MALLLALSLTVGMVAGGSLALWGIGGAVLLYVLEVARQRRLVPIDPVLASWAAVFLMLALLAQLTALDANRSWPMIGSMLTIIVPLLLFFPLWREAVIWPSWVIRVLPWVMLGCMTLLLLEFYSDGSILLPLLRGKGERLIYYNRGLSYAAVLIWPLVALLLHAGRNNLALLLVALLLVTTWCSTSRGAVLALVTGGGFWLLGRYTPRCAFASAAALLAVVALGVLVAVPWLFTHHPDWLGHIPASWRHRTEIWDFLLHDWARHWWFGQGLDATGLIAPDTPRQSLYLYAMAAAAHPHHMFLQVLLEMGPLGWLWGVGAAAFALWRLWQWPEAQRPAGLAAWGALLILACGSFSLWADSFWATGALAALLLSGAQSAPAR